MSRLRINSQTLEPCIKIRNNAGSEDIHYFSLYEGLPEKFQLYAREHLNETDENKARGLQKLKVFMQMENLGSVDDLLLLAVLRNCKYDIKKSKPKLKRFLKQRQNAISDLAHLDMKTILHVLDDLVYSFLPYRDKHGRIITYSRPNFHFENYTMSDVILVCKIMMLFMLRYPMTTVTGVAHIGENRCPLHIYYPVFKNFKGILSFLLDCPLRIGRWDSVNSHFLTRLLDASLRTFLPGKIHSRVFVHGGGYEVLENVYHPSLLSDEVGGTAGPLTDSFYRDKLIKFIEELKSEGAVGNSASKHP